MRDEPAERPEPTQPVAYIGGRYVYSHPSDDHHAGGLRRGLLTRHRSRAA